MNRTEYKAAIMENMFKKHNLPYVRHLRDSDFSFMERPQIQFTFPWHDGDVIMDTLSHITPESDLAVESYGFPWDEDDVTRLDPKVMANRIICFYQEQHI